MTNVTIHNFAYLLTEIEKNLITMEESREQEYIALQSMHIICSTMTKMCQNYEEQPSLWD